MEIDIGSYVREHLFDQVYRYGIVVGIGEGDFTDIIKIIWTPRNDHPIANGPYKQSAHISKIEVVRE